ncbi:MAG: GGDEF domain-containing protein [Ruminococcus sp.]|nr:GGDEF domain-containing protein [Ruminococcus sp.]
MLTDRRLFFTKNVVLLVLCVLSPICCVIFSTPFPCDFSDWNISVDYLSNLSGFFSDNVFHILFFFVFVSVGLTAMILSYIISRKFDRNRDSGRSSFRLGSLYILVGFFIITNSRIIGLFQDTRYIIEYFSSVCFLFIPVTILACIETFYNKKAFYVLDLIASFNSAVFFVYGTFGTNPSVTRIVLFFNQLLTYVSIIMFLVMFSRRELSKLSDKKYLSLILAVVSGGACVASAVCFFAGYSELNLLLFGLSMLFISLLLFDELLTSVVRKYVRNTEFETYRQLAYTDSLCDVKNRNAFMREQEATFEMDSLFYVVFDVNNMKRINDRYGHSAGDEIIKAAAKSISKSFSQIGECYRIGGDEFAVLGHYKAESSILKSIKRMNKLIREYNETADPALDLAYGYAMRESADVSTYELFNKADKAMYRFKRKGTVIAFSARNA